MWVTLQEREKTPQNLNKLILLDNVLALRTPTYLFRVGKTGALYICRPTDLMTSGWLYFFFFGNSIRLNYNSKVILKICLLKVCCVNKVYQYKVKTKGPTTSTQSLLHKMSKPTAHTHDHF